MLNIHIVTIIAVLQCLTLEAIDDNKIKVLEIVYLITIYSWVNVNDSVQKTLWISIPAIIDNSLFIYSHDLDQYIWGTYFNINIHYFKRYCIIYAANYGFIHHLQ